MVLGYLNMVSQPSAPSSKVGCMKANGDSQAKFARAVGTIAGDSFERPLSEVQLLLSLFIGTVTVGKHACLEFRSYNYNCEHMYLSTGCSC